MQLVILSLFIGLIVHDEYAASWPAGPGLSAPWLLAAVIGPKLLLAIAYALACRRTLRLFQSSAAARAFQRIETLTVAYTLAVIPLYGLDLWLGWVTALRGAVGDRVLIDELLALAPSVGLIVWGWWVYYPIDRRLREARLLSRLDRGLPVYPTWSRGQYLVAHLRHQLALLFVPLTLLIGWSEAVWRYVPAGAWGFGADPRPGVALGGALVIFLFAPVLLRHIFDTAPLPPGEVRRSLDEMCRHQRVGVRELLLWRTHGVMLNAAVMGLIAPLRYILLTDALLDTMRRDEVEAVMAHELAHVRRHHMFWLLAGAVGSLGVIEVAAQALGRALGVWGEGGGATGGEVLVRAGWAPAWLSEPWFLSAMLTVGALLAWLAVFGWISRRVERQADTHAVEYLVERQPEPTRDQRGLAVVDAGSVETMVSALQTVAELNNISPRRPTWRHGSIAWRQAYLRGLVGRPVDRLEIHRVMARVKLACLAAIGLIALAYFWPGVHLVSF